MSLRCAAERMGVTQSVETSSGDLLSQKLAQYASMLAAQGALSAALTYLGPTGGDQNLRERLTGALGQSVAAAAVSRHDPSGRRSRLTSTSSNAAQASRISGESKTIKICIFDITCNICNDYYTQSLANNSSPQIIRPFRDQSTFGWDVPTPCTICGRCSWRRRWLRVAHPTTQPTFLLPSATTTQSV